jgi:hypothetical protein
MAHNLIIDYVVESTRGSLSFVLHHSPCGSNFKCGIISHVLDVSEGFNKSHSQNISEIPEIDDKNPMGYSYQVFSNRVL